MFSGFYCVVRDLARDDHSQGSEKIPRQGGQD